jgi:hypothetical protein
MLELFDRDFGLRLRFVSDRHLAGKQIDTRIFKVDEEEPLQYGSQSFWNQRATRLAIEPANRHIELHFRLSDTYRHLQGSRWVQQYTKRKQMAGAAIYCYMAVILQT